MSNSRDNTALPLPEPKDEQLIRIALEGKEDTLTLEQHNRLPASRADESSSSPDSTTTSESPSLSPIELTASTEVSVTPAVAPGTPAGSADRKLDFKGLPTYAIKAPKQPAPQPLPRPRAALFYGTAPQATEDTAPAPKKCCVIM